MIIQGHPDILLGPQGLNGLHGFGSTPEPRSYSQAEERFRVENGGLGVDVLYKEIRDFINTPGRTEAEIQQAMAASGVTDFDVSKAFAFKPDADDYSVNLDEFAVDDFVKMPDGYVYEQQPTGLAPIPDSSLRNREIVDYVTTHSDAEILAAMATTGVTQSDIIRAFASFDATMPNGQSPAYARSLPENGGGGIANYYKEINDFVNSHSFYEVLSQMFRSEVSRADLEAANSFAFEKQQSQTPAEYAAAQAAIAAQAAQAQQAVKAAQAAQAAAAAAATAKAAAAQAATAAATTAAAKATAAATAAAASAATAAGVVIAKTSGESAAYTRFLPENGGKGITALYKEISDFVGTHSNAEIKTAMTASGVSEVDVIKALQVFPNKTMTQPVKDTGLTLPLVISAIAAYFVLG